MAPRLVRSTCHSVAPLCPSCPVALLMLTFVSGDRNTLRGFDEKAYLAAKQLKPGKRPPTGNHAFNQLESDKLSPDRPIRTPAIECGLCCAGGERWREGRPQLAFFDHVGLRSRENFLRLSPAPETYNHFLSVVFPGSPLSFTDLLRV